MIDSSEKVLSILPYPSNPLEEAGKWEIRSWNFELFFLQKNLMFSINWVCAFPSVTAVDSKNVRYFLTSLRMLFFWSSVNRDLTLILSNSLGYLSRHV